LVIWIAAPLLALYLAHWLTDLRRQQAKLPRLTAHLSELGCPTTPDEFEAMIAVPDEENAVEEYARLFAEIDRLQSEEQSDRLTHDVFQTTVSDESLLVPCQTLLKLLAEAARKPSLRINVLRHELTNLEPTGPHLRFMAKVMIRKVLIDAEQGDLASCKADMAVFRRLCDHSLYDATRLSWIIYVSVSSLYVQTVGLVLKRSHRDPGFLDWAEEALRALPPLPPLRSHIKGDVAYSFEYYRQNRGQPLLDVKVVSLTALFGYFHSPRAWDAYLSSDLQGVTYMLDKWPVDDDWRKIASLTRPGWIEGKWWIAPSLGWPSAQIGGVLRGPGDAMGSYMGRRYLAHLGLAIYRYAEKHGRFPASLDERSFPTSDSLPAPLHYWPKDNSFVLRCGAIEF
jgi:hypothetical protein